jgi:hypothetical protein
LRSIIRHLLFSPSSPHTKSGLPDLVIKEAAEVG